MCAEPTNSRVETETLGMESFSLIRSQIASEERPSKPEYILSPPPPCTLRVNEQGGWSKHGGWKRITGAKSPSDWKVTDVSGQLPGWTLTGEFGTFGVPEKGALQCPGGKFEHRVQNSLNKAGYLNWAPCVSGGCLLSVFHWSCTMQLSGIVAVMNIRKLKLGAEYSRQSVIVPKSSEESVIIMKMGFCFL